jgi:thiamine biosynthesis lipoprotein
MRTIRINRARPGLGTIIRLAAQAPTESIARAAIELAWQEIRQVDERLNPDRPDSDLATLHAAPPGERVPASAMTLGLLRRARALFLDSDGHFDPCLPQGQGTLADLEIGPRSLRRRAPLLLDLGGIAKGHAVDRAVMALRRSGCRAGVVDAGGDLRVFGPRPEPVRVGRSGVVVVEIANAALAVSEPTLQAPPGHRGHYSRVAGALQQARAAAVLAPTAAEADALAKCALFMPELEAAELCARRGAQLLPCTWLLPGAWDACSPGRAQRSQLTQPESPPA